MHIHTCLLRATHLTRSRTPSHGSPTLQSQGGSDETASQIAEVADQPTRSTLSAGGCYGFGHVTTGLGTWRTHGYLLYLEALLPLSLFRFDVLVTVHLYDSL